MSLAWEVPAADISRSALHPSASAPLPLCKDPTRALQSLWQSLVRLQTSFCLQSHYQAVCRTASTCTATIIHAGWNALESNTVKLLQYKTCPQVRTRTDLPQYNRPTAEVIRRFRDFTHLENMLSEKNK